MTDTRTSPPVLDIWPSLTGYRVVFARADTFELLGNFPTLREAGDAKREAERLVSRTLTQDVA